MKEMTMTIEEMAKERLCYECDTELSIDTTLDVDRLVCKGCNAITTGYHKEDKVIIDQLSKIGVGVDSLEPVFELIKISRNTRMLELSAAGSEEEKYKGYYESACRTAVKVTSNNNTLRDEVEVVQAANEGLQATVDKQAVKVKELKEKIEGLEDTIMEQKCIIADGETAGYSVAKMVAEEIGRGDDKLENDYVEAVELMKRFVLAPVPHDRAVALEDDLCVARIESLHFLQDRDIIQLKKEIFDDSLDMVDIEEFEEYEYQKNKDTVQRGFRNVSKEDIPGTLKFQAQRDAQPLGPIREVNLKDIEHIHEGMGGSFTHIQFKDGTSSSTKEKYDGLVKQIVEQFTKTQV